MLCAAAMTANQIGAKATRDAFYLSTYDVTTLPRMVVAAAVVSIAVVVVASALLAHRGPRRVVPAAFLASALLLLFEWGLAGTVPKAAAIVFYLHVAALGSVLISAFWSLVNETLDPRRARRWIGRIGAAATLGGVVGGLLAVAAGSAVSVTGMFPLLAGLHAASGLIARRLQPLARFRRPAGRAPSTTGGFEALRRSSYLRNLATLVVLLTLGATLVDYVFKAEATTAFADGEALLRFFAAFYTGLSVMTFLVQLAFGRIALQRMGLARTVGLLPVAAGLTGAVALVFPRLASLTAARAAEAVLRSSLYRSGYEVLFNPVSPQDRRSAKPIIDVGCDRLGDAIGGGIVLAVLAVASGWSTPVLMAGAVAAFAGAIVLIPGLQQGFVGVLVQSMRDQADELELDAWDDPGSATVADSLSGMQLSTILTPEMLARLTGRQAARDESAPPEREPRPAAATNRDPIVDAIARLRSRDPAAIREVLAGPSLDPVLTPHLIPLLAWNAVAREAAEALRGIVPGILGQLSDALLDPDGEFAVRRRIPRVLRESDDPRAAAALRDALDDARFEVRYQAGLALARIHRRTGTTPLAPREIERAVAREIGVNRQVWEGYRLIDAGAEDSDLVDDALRGRVNRCLEHVFTLLSLSLPREPLRVAFRGLHAADATLRATALEYLETVLSEDAARALWPLLEETRSRSRPPSGNEENRTAVLDRLMSSRISIDEDVSRFLKKDQP
jgi:hypothetical protein